MQLINNFGDILKLAPDTDALAYIDCSARTKEWTIRQFWNSVEHVTGLFQNKGLGVDSRIGLLALNSAEYLICYFAAMRSGLTPVPINYRLTRKTIDYIVRDASIKLIITDEVHHSLTPDGIEAIGLDEFLTSAQKSIKTTGSVHPQGQIPCKILYTSGTSGEPKGTLLDHAGQIWAIRQSLKQLRATESRVMVSAPYYHKNGLYFASYAIAAGATVVSMPWFNARAYLQATVDYQCDWLTGIPTMFALMLRESDLFKSNTFSFVRKISIGSAPLSESLVESLQKAFPNAELINGYGATEAGPIIFAKHPDGLARPTLSVGYPAEGVHCQLVGTGAPNQGRLLVRSPSVMREYLNKPGLTEISLKDGWYDTGDNFHVDENGFYFFVGRSDDMFVCGGENIYPAQVEKLLEQHPLVSQAVVVSVPDGIKGAIPVGFVVLKQNSTTTEQEIKAFSLENGPAFSHPRAIIFKNVMPIGGTHKIDRKLLQVEARQVLKARSNQ